MKAVLPRRIGRDPRMHEATSRMCHYDCAQQIQVRRPPESDKLAASGCLTEALFAQSKLASGAMAGTSIASPQDVQSAIKGNPSTMTRFHGTQFSFGGAWVEPTYNLTVDADLNAFGVQQFTNAKHGHGKPPRTPKVWHFHRPLARVHLIHPIHPIEAVPQIGFGEGVAGFDHAQIPFEPKNLTVTLVRVFGVD
jgi:hypothetical protein